MSDETGAKTKMDERRWGQQEMLERLLETSDHIHEELGHLTVAMTNRVAQLEERAANHATTLSGLSIAVGRHTESISWIKGAGAASVLILGALEVVLGCVLAWFLSHVGLKP